MKLHNDSDSAYLWNTGSETILLPPHSAAEAELPGRCTLTPVAPSRYRAKIQFFKFPPLLSYSFFVRTEAEYDLSAAPAELILRERTHSVNIGDQTAYIGAELTFGNTVFPATGRAVVDPKGTAVAFEKKHRTKDFRLAYFRGQRGNWFFILLLVSLVMYPILFSISRMQFPLSDILCVALILAWVSFSILFDLLFLKRDFRKDGFSEKVSEILNFTPHF